MKFAVEISLFSLYNLLVINTNISFRIADIKQGLFIERGKYGIYYNNWNNFFNSDFIKKEKILKFLFAIGLVIACVYVAVNFFNMLSAFDSSFLSIIIYGAIALIAFLIVASIIYLAAERAKDKKGIKRWLALPVNQYTAEDIENYIERYATILDDSDSDKRKYSNIFYNIPYGRTNCFLSYFERTIYNEEPIYYSAVRSKIKEELREYGTLLTSAGL